MPIDSRLYVGYNKVISQSEIKQRKLEMISLTLLDLIIIVLMSSITISVVWTIAGQLARVAMRIRKLFIVTIKVKKLTIRYDILTKSGDITWL